MDLDLDLALDSEALQSDLHVHSIFSDGMHTFDELATAAHRLGLQTLGICDHCDEYMAAYGAPRLLGYHHALLRWANLENSVRVLAGVELDLLEPDGRIADLERCRDRAPRILSAHRTVYRGAAGTVTDAYLRAIDRHADQLDIIGHPCSCYFGPRWEDGVDIERLVAHANDAGLALEVNGANLMRGKTNTDKLRYLCQNARRLVASSDAHTTAEMGPARQKALDFIHG